MTNPEIVPCRMCKGREDVKSPRRYQMNRQTWVGCGTLSCAVDGPRRHTEPEAIAAWNELMQPIDTTIDELKANCEYDPILLERAWLAAIAYGDFGGTRVFCSRQKFVSTEWWAEAWINVVCEADENVGHARMTRAFRCFNNYRISSKQPTYSRAEFDACAPSLREAWAKTIEVISPCRDCAAPEMQSKTVRVPVHIQAVIRKMIIGGRDVYSLIHTALASDGTMWVRHWEADDGHWRQINDLPQPATVEARDD